jgi:hypothetical protein
MNDFGSEPRGVLSEGSELHDQDGQTRPQVSRLPCYLVAFGRGNSGKSTGLRYLGERALAAGRRVLICDCDRNNQTLTAFFGNAVERPDYPDDDSVIAFLNRCADSIASSSLSVVLDMGGGDLVFPRYARSLQLANLLEENGVRPVAMHFVGPALDDLTTLQEIEQSGAFCPDATVIVLNAGLIRDTRTPDAAFKAVRDHETVKAAEARGALVVTMPRLACMHEIDQRRLTFADAQKGRVKPGQEPLGLTMRQMVTIWRRGMESAFTPAEEWLP